MTCEFITLPDGTKAIVCGDRKRDRKPRWCHCGRPAGFQCAEEMPARGRVFVPNVCGRWVCQLHAAKIGPTRYRCSECTGRLAWTPPARP